MSLILHVLTMKYCFYDKMQTCPLSLYKECSFQSELLVSGNFEKKGSISGRKKMHDML